MKTIWRIVKLARPWRAFIFLAVFAVLFISAINLVTPMVVRELLSRIEDGSITETIIFILAFGLLGLYLLRVLLTFVSTHAAHIAAWSLVGELRGKLYRHVQDLSLKYYQDKQTGQIMARVMEDTAAQETLIAHALPDLITSGLTFAGVLTVMFFINPVLAGFVCIPLPLILLVGIFTRKLRKTFQKRKIVSAELMGMLADNFQGIKEIQIFNKQEFEGKKVSDKAKLHAQMTKRGVFWIAILNPLMNLLQGLGTIAIILAGGLLAVKGIGVAGISAADITAFLLYVGLLYAPVANLARIIEDTQEGATSGRRIFEVLDTKSEIQNRPNAQDVGVLKGEIEFKNVSFDYNAVPEENVEPRPENIPLLTANDDSTVIAEPVDEHNSADSKDKLIKAPPVLSRVSFTVPEGKMIALVGPTGAGKTTIISLIARFYDITKGSITIDGIDIRDMTLESLRQNISIVLQDVYLFSGTIFENIAYGRADAVSEKEVIEAAKAAAVHDFIAGLPDGYQTKVGERGVRLSGGQKQRIAIARAVLRKSPILILDEATSAVDNETEREIQNAINTIAGKRTMIVIAHRLSTVERADEILYLENGTVKERGTHKALLAKGGAYTKMRQKG